MSEQNSNILELHNIVKDFPGVRALDHVDFSVRKGEIHGLVGENGAGKSTLIKIIAGVYQRDAGDVYIRGETCGHLSPRQVEDLGIQFIHQERYLVPDFSVAQSIFLGQELLERPWLPLVNNQRMRRQAEQFIEETLGVSLPGNALIRDLSVAQQQLVQIAKALMARPAIIAFDEPTAPLARREVERLFEIIRRLQEQGVTIIYISHYLQEITEICDRVTVLRNGVRVATLPLSETTHDQIVRLMVGRELEEMYPARAVAIREPILTVKNLTRHGEFRNIDFTVHRGEVIGITGLLGSGRHNLAETLYGLRQPDAGEIILKGTPVRRWSSAKAVSQGVGLVPKDRREQGLVLNMSVTDNINLPSLGRVARTAGFLNHRSARQRAVSMIDSLAIRTPGPETAVRYLSGGNQQKVVIGKWLTSGAAVYLLDEPTVGVDVGAKAEIYHLINRLVADGAGVILISSDIPELLGTTDRILIMYRGQIVKELDTKQATPDSILFWATGGKEDQNGK